jgi:hypothetical protein
MSHEQALVSSLAFGCLSTYLLLSVNLFMMWAKEITLSSKNLTSRKIHSISLKNHKKKYFFYFWSGIYSICFLGIIKTISLSATESTFSTRPICLKVTTLLSKNMWNEQNQKREKNTFILLRAESVTFQFLYHLQSQLFSFFSMKMQWFTHSHRFVEDNRHVLSFHSVISH